MENEIYEADDLVSNWVMQELPTGEVHSIDSTTPRLAGIALLLIDACRSANQPLVPSRWLLDNRDGLLNAIGAAQEVEETASLLDLSEEALNDAVERARAAVGGAAHQQEEADDEALRAAQVTSTQQAQFHKWVVDEWAQRQSLRRLLVAAGLQVIEVDGAAPNERLRVTPTLVSKFWIADSRGEIGFEQVGRDFGRSIAAGESRRIAELLSAGDESEESDLDETDVTVEGFALQIQRAVNDLCDSGYRPTLILRGWSPVLWKAITVEPLTSEERSKLPDEIIGRWSGILVARPGYVGESHLAVVDAGAWAEIREWNVDGDAVQTALTTYDAESGSAYLDANPSLFAGLASDDERLIELQRHMLVEVSAAVEFKITDPMAVRVVCLRDHTAE